MSKNSHIVAVNALTSIWRFEKAGGAHAGSFLAHPIETEEVPRNLGFPSNDWLRKRRPDHKKGRIVTQCVSNITVFATVQLQSSVECYARLTLVDPIVKPCNTGACDIWVNPRHDCSGDEKCQS